MWLKRSIFWLYVLCEFIGSQRNMLISCIYRSPSSSIEKDKKLFNMLEDIIGMNYADNIIVGDFNYQKHWIESDPIGKSDHTVIIINTNIEL